LFRTTASPSSRRLRDGVSRLPSLVIPNIMHDTAYFLLQTRLSANVIRNRDC
jgi:hypothetical protein